MCFTCWLQQKSYDVGAKRVTCEIKTHPVNGYETLFGSVQHVMTVNSCIVDMSCAGGFSGHC